MQLSTLIMRGGETLRSLADEFGEDPMYSVPRPTDRDVPVLQGEPMDEVNPPV